MDGVKAVVLANAPVATGGPAFVRRHALELVSVANKPLLFYALEALRDAGLEEAIVVVGPDAGEEIREAVRDGSQWGLRVSYVVRRQPGVVRAIRAAEPQLGSASLIVYPANGILLAPLLPLLRSFHRGRLQALLPVRLDDEQERGSVTTLRGARVADELRRMVELDHQLDHEGVYVFGPMIHEAAHRTAPSWRGDYELADVIETMVAAGQRIRARPMEEWVSYDGGARALLHANRLLLDRLVDDRAQAQIADSTIEGRVAVAASASVESSTIRGPAIIGPGATLADAYIGPYTSVGASAVVRGAEIENSVIMAGAEVRDLEARLSGSVIGEGVTVKRDFSLPRVLELAVAHGSTAMLG